MVAPGEFALFSGFAAGIGNLAGQVVGNVIGVQDGINFGQIA